jgi:hypothetical protein
MSTDILLGVGGCILGGGLLLVFGYVAVMLFSVLAPRIWNDLIDRFL